MATVMAMATALAAPVVRVVRVRSKFMANSFMSEAFHVARCWLRCLFVGALISSMVEAWNRPGRVDYFNQQAAVQADATRENSSNAAIALAAYINDGPPPM